MSSSTLCLCIRIAYPTRRVIYKIYLNVIKPVDKTTITVNITSKVTEYFFNKHLTYVTMSLVSCSFNFFSYNLTLRICCFSRQNNTRFKPRHTRAHVLIRLYDGVAFNILHTVHAMWFMCGTPFDVEWP